MNRTDDYIHMDFEAAKATMAMQESEAIEKTAVAVLLAAKANGAVTIIASPAALLTGITVIVHPKVYDRLRDEKRDMAKKALSPLFSIRRKDGEEPCGECHMQPDETCDICCAKGASA
ncbi:hypothetical protein HGO34_15620 [Agrobacterium vitis]|uniref:hypothetical protein n=1 Tax=Agrobacterium vitis TaxID=373 RepID=UPI002033B726|nr:hypothetical protein [Agrobacterium vitis]MCM2441150.1 hypothetical protein [Agrobacterium vitis]